MSLSKLRVSPNRLTWTVFVASMIMQLTACTSTQRPPTGVLVIAGGAVKDRGPVMPRFFAEANKAAKRKEQASSILVIPTASSNPERSMRLNLDSFHSIAPGQMSRGLLLDSARRESANADAIATDLTQATSLWFTGGNQARITDLFHPQSEANDPFFFEATHALIQQGGVLGGSSAGAAMMSQHMIAGGTSEKALIHGWGPEGVRTEPGMGYFPFGIVDQHFLARGRYARLLVALDHHKERFGFGIDENCALVVSLGETPVCEAVGAGAVCLLDIGPNRIANHDDFWKAELSLLGHGDRWYPASHKIVPRAGRIPLENGSRNTLPTTLAPDPWGKNVLLATLQKLSRHPTVPQVIESELHRITLSSGPSTRFLIAPHHGADLLAERVQLVIERR